MYDVHIHIADGHYSQRCEIVKRLCLLTYLDVNLYVANTHTQKQPEALSKVEQ